MGGFSYGLLNPKDCITDWKLCLLSYCFPFAPFGIAADKVIGEGDGYRCLILSGIPIVQYAVLPCWRMHVREAKGVDGNLLFDCLASYCCPCCTIFQASHQAGVDGDHEISKTIELMKRGAESFSPQKEMEKAKEQSKEAADDAKKSAEEAKQEAVA
ncbi:uncharacterized protein LOC134848078 [Symsagittifera roscoffensis]|uniref:uncharacterized protein LOC134848078 n=1 Tax=Symsagittifera roscoffensis TaxID=84072 RepID=UPI00307C46E9